eukprot:330414_1
MGKCKSLLPKQNDPVECTTCGDTFARKYTDSHWRKHQTKLPIHSEDIPISQRVVTVKPKSNLTNLWSKSNTPKIKTKKQTNDMKYETGRNILCVLHEASENMQQVQPTLIDIYNKIESDLHEKENIVNDAAYLLTSVRDILQSIDGVGDTLSLADFCETPENDYTSLIGNLVEQKMIFNKTEQLLKNIQSLVQSKEYEIWSLEDALLKFHFHGLRLSEHDNCEAGEALLYCNVCCKDPIYPSKGRGSIKTGLVTRLDDYKEDSITWRSTKQCCRNHFYGNTSSVHFLNLDCNKAVFERKCLEAKLNQFKVVLRLTNADVSLLLFKRDAPLMKEDKRLSAGYCREMFDVLLPVCIVAQIESFCMNFGYEEPIYNDLGGVLLRYGRSDNVNLRTALNFWKNKMNES